MLQKSQLLLPLLITTCTFRRRLFNIFRCEDQPWVVTVWSSHEDGDLSGQIFISKPNLNFDFAREATNGRWSLTRSARSTSRTARRRKASLFGSRRLAGWDEVRFCWHQWCHITPSEYFSRWSCGLIPSGSEKWESWRSTAVGASNSVARHPLHKMVPSQLEWLH